MKFAIKQILVAVNVVGIATGYGLEDLWVGVRVPVGPKILSLPRRPDRLWDPPNILWVPGAISPA
jgi:hypothetical protein